MEKRILDKIHESNLNILDEFVKICKKYNLTYFLVGGTLLGAVRHNGFIPWDDDLDVGMPREDYEFFISNYYKKLNSKFELDVHDHNKLYWLPFAKIRLKNTTYIESGAKNYIGDQGIWIDIFPLDSISNIKKAKIQKKITTAIRAEMGNRQNIINNIDKRKKKILKMIFIGFNSNKTLGKLQNKIMKLQNKKQNTEYFANFGSQYEIEKQKQLKEKYFPLKKMKFEGKLYNVPNDYDYVLTKIYGKNYMELPPVEKRVTHNPLKIVFEDGEEVIFDEEI